MQCYASPTEQTIAPPTALGAIDTHYRGEPRELPPANTHCSSIATFSQEQKSTMATMTTTATAATTTVRPGTPPTTTTTTTTASQRVASNLQTAMWRTPGGSRGSGSPGGGGPAPAAPAVPAGGNAPMVNPDDRLMGSLPQLFDGNRKLTWNFLDQLTTYFWANT
jgi:hypothetical protein